MSIQQLVYSSRDPCHHTAAARVDRLKDILAVSRRNNVRDEITGFLIADEDWFFQVLEGEGSRVLAAYERIRRDGRHGDVTCLSSREARNRSFPRWSMGAAIRDPAQDAIYRRHAITGRLDPATIIAPTIVALAMDLQDHEAARAFAA